MSALRDYARSYADAMERFGNTREALIYRMLVEHGQDAAFTPLPDGEECGFAKQCFRNAAHRALDDDGLTYYEGLASGVIAMPHAWLQDTDGRVYELTLRHNDARCPYCDGEGQLAPTDHHDYYGHDEDDDDWDDADIECEMCGGTGEGEARSQEDTAYLGIPVPLEVLRESLVENKVYGVLFEDPERVAKAHEWCYSEKRVDRQEVEQ